MPGLWAVTTRSPGETLTATKYNSDGAEPRDNDVPLMHDDYSASAVQMQVTTDPGEVGTESLPTSLAGELERLRFAVKEIKSVLVSAGPAQWYTTVANDFKVPTGGMIAYGAAAAPAGWLLCDGSAVSRTTFAALFAVVGTAYGTGDGATTFNVPDKRDRSPVGASATKALGSRAGSTAYTPAGTNSAPAFTGNALPGVSYTLNNDGNAANATTGTVITANGAGGLVVGGGAGPGLGQKNTTVAASAGTPTGTVSAPAFTGTAATIQPPYEADTWIIKT